MGLMSAATGTFVNPGRGLPQSTGFVLDPAGKVVVSVYPGRAIGRLVRRRRGGAGPPPGPALPPDEPGGMINR